MAEVSLNPNVANNDFTLTTTPFTGDLGAELIRLDVTDKTGWRDLQKDTDFDDQPASAYTITMVTDQTAYIKVGMALKLKVQGSYQYAIVAAITANLLTISGKPLTLLDGDLTEIWFDQNPSRVSLLSWHFHNAGAILSAGAQGDRIVPNNSEVCQVVMMGDISASAQVDLWNEDDAGTLPPQDADSICGGDEPVLAADIFDVKTQFTGWTHSLLRNSIVRVNLDSVSGGLVRLEVVVYLVQTY
jgi:hypothetical protein